MAAPITEVNSGTCDFCPRTGVHVVIVRGDWMCDVCLADEQKTPSMSAATMIAESRTIDSSIQIKTDIFLAKSVAAIELKRAIDADDTIPADQKNYVMARESLTRFQTMQKAIFDERQAFLAGIREKENELRMWQTQVQTFGGLVENAKKKEFQNFDMNYQPVVVKPVKPTKSGTSPKKFDKEAVFAAAKKYGVPADGIQYLVKASHLTVEAAAIKLATSMGLLK